jgi:surface polysaccharide O-acyltransferase-like enzyme
LILEKNIIWLDSARIIAIFAVVWLHVSSDVVNECSVGTWFWWFGNFYDSIVRWSVPLFVMISGALLLDVNKKEGLLLFYRKRIFRILYPLLFWSGFFVIWLFFKLQATGHEPSFVALMKNVLVGKPYYHMWFIYMLLSLYLFVPFLRKIVSLSSERDLIFLVAFLFILAATNAIYVTIYPDNGPGLFIISFLPYLPYFIMGHLVMQISIKPKRLVLFSGFVFSFLATLFGYYFFSKADDLNIANYFYSYLSITVIPMSVCIMLLLKDLPIPIVNERITSTFSSLTLGVYFIHPIILEVINKNNFSVMSFNPLISVPAVTILIYAISLVAAWIIMKLPYLRRVI